MNLYKIMMEHHAPKDNKQGIYTYLAADASEDVYEWLKKEIRLKDDRIIYVNYKMDEEYDECEDGEETFKDRIIRVQGCMYDEYTEYSDLYYGKTVMGWSIVKEDIEEKDIQMLENMNIAVEVA